MSERLQVIVSGRVQMVMYRDFTQRNANKLGLSGQARNLSDGTVEVIAEGPREKLEYLLSKLHQGPLFAHVEHINVSWMSATNEFFQFRIVYE